MTEVTRVALITGGGTGIGAAAAKRFAAQGTAVALVGRRPEPLDETAGVIRNAGGEALAIPADLGNPVTPPRIVAAVVETWGRLDILVNNAAAIKHLPIDQATLEVFDEHMAVNVRAPYFLTQAALPYLRQSGSGAVINISSSSGSLYHPSPVHVWDFQSRLGIPDALPGGRTGAPGGAGLAPTLRQGSPSPRRSRSPSKSARM